MHLRIAHRLCWQSAALRVSDPVSLVVPAEADPAENKLVAFNGRWNGDIDRAFEEYAY